MRRRDGEANWSLVNNGLDFETFPLGNGVLDTRLVSTEGRYSCCCRGDNDLDRILCQPRWRRQLAGYRHRSAGYYPSLFNAPAAKEYCRYRWLHIIPARCRHSHFRRPGAQLNL